MILKYTVGEGEKTFKYYDPEINSRVEAKAVAERLFEKVDEEFDQVQVQGGYPSDVTEGGAS